MSVSVIIDMSAYLLVNIKLFYIVMIGLLSGIWILVGIVRTTLSIGISKHLYRTIRHSIVLNRVNEIILPKTIFVYKRNDFSVNYYSIWLHGCLDVRK